MIILLLSKSCIFFLGIHRLKMEERVETKSLTMMLVDSMKTKWPS